MLRAKAGLASLLTLALVAPFSAACTGAGTPAPATARSGSPASAASAGSATSTAVGDDGEMEREHEPLDHRREEERESPEEAATNRAMEHAIERALSHPEARGDLHLLTECTGDGGFRQVEVYGNGVTIWNRARQYGLEQQRVGALLEALDHAGFADMEPMYGQEELDAAMRVICRVMVTLDGVTKQSGQLDEGPQNQQLKELARTLLDSAFEPPDVGITADDLNDGLTKLADGRLAPEAFHVLVNRKPDDYALSQGEPGYLLRIDGRRAAVQRFSARDGYADPVEHTLDDDELSGLAKLLAGQRAGDLPGNLYAVHYTDLVVEVLDRSQRIQARQFANTTHATHGEAQERFDKILSGLSELALRILGEA